MNSIKNLVWGILNSLLTVSAGIIVPCYIIQYLGSESNGFFSALNQIYAYLSLLDAGVAVAAVQALYVPIVQNHTAEINSILYTTRQYYKKISMIYAAIVGLLSFILPFFLQTPFSYATVCLSFACMGAGQVLSFAIQGKIIVYLIAAGKKYYIHIASILFLILVNVGKLLLAYRGFNIVLIFLLQLAVQAGISLYYVLLQKYKYAGLDFTVRSSTTCIEQNKYGLIEQIAFIIFMNTDIVLISIFMNMFVVSKYSLYTLVTHNIYTFVGLTWDAVHASLAKIYITDLNRFNRLEQILENAFVLLSFWLYTMVMFLLIPFMRLYTNAISDYNYIDIKLAFLLTVSYLLFCIRNPFISLSLDTGYIKRSSEFAIIEVIINIVLSIVLFTFFSYYGFVYATIIGTGYRLVVQVLFVKKTIQKEHLFPFIKNMGMCICIFCICIAGENFLHITNNITSWSSFFLVACIMALSTLTLYCTYFFLFSKKELSYLINFIKTIKQDRHR